MAVVLETKEAAREWVWALLKKQGVQRFPFLPKRRIPNFKGSDVASVNLFQFPEIARASIIKCNPDSPQRAFREEALRRGIVLLLPTPRLVDDFLILDPERIADSSYGPASRSSGFSTYGVFCSLRDIPQPQVTIVGSVAISERGGRCGKGHGYADMESAMLKEVGIQSTPVFSSVHEFQLVKDFPVEQTDLRLSGVSTPQGNRRFLEEVPEWPSLDWSKVSQKQMRQIPLLGELLGSGDSSPLTERTLS